MAKKKKKDDPIFGRKLSTSEFKYFDQLGIQLPAIVLGVEVPSYAFDSSDYGYKEYDFKKDRKWLKIAHQTAGHCCHQQYIIGTVLQPKSVDVLKNMHKIADHWDGTDAGLGSITLREANEYDKQLREYFNASCNASWKGMEEGFYPVDVRYIDSFTSEKLPSNLDDLINWKDGFERCIGCLNRWNLWILTENSD